MNYLLFHKRSYISGRGLATQLGLKATRSVGKIKKLGKIPIIRYGNSEGSFGKNDTIMNAPGVIRLCANSYHFSRWCEKNNYLTPIYRKFSMSNIPEYPFLLRRLHHMQGRDIILINSKKDLNKVSRQELSGRYYVPFFNTGFELRVHVIDGKVVRIFKKLKVNADSKEFIRTSGKGWHYSLRTDSFNKYTKAIEICLNLVKDVGLFFGGIDLAWDNVNKKYIIWEVNTAPGLSKPTMKIYADALRKYV